MTEPLERLTAALADRYAIERELGAGGMATVYLATDQRHHRQVALKVLRPEIAATLGAGRFAREIEVAARLQHPNILPLLDSGEAAGFFFYVMPYVEGESLRDRLARGGELPIPDAVRILTEVADALSEAHAHGVVHRDIKPDNVMLRGRHALVTDFGVAKAVTEATGRQVLTSAGVALGTPAYMAPEQATADPHQDHRVDIYALGVLGYELLTGRAPFSATTAQEMLAAHVTAEPDPLEKYRPTVSPALAAVVMKCLAKKPADRWQTADEVVAALEPLAAPSGGTTPTEAVPGTGRRARRRTIALSAGSAAVVVAVGLLLTWQFLRPRALDITVSGVTQVTSERGIEYQPAISPDGKEVAFVAGPVETPHLYISSTVNVAAGGAIRRSDPSLTGELFPGWSSDGQSVRFWGCPRRPTRETGCGWREIGKLAGAAQAVPLPSAANSGDTAGQAHLAGFSPAVWVSDGAEVVFVRGDTIYLAARDGGAPRRLAVNAGQAHSFTFSPSGSRVAWVQGNVMWLRYPNVDISAIWAADVAGGLPVQVTARDHLNVSPAWLDDTHLLFVSDRDGQRAVYAVEVGSRGPRGEPHAVPGIVDPHTISYSVPSRRLVYSKMTGRTGIWTYPLRSGGTISIRNGETVTMGTQLIETNSVSPDGQSIVYSSTLRGHRDLYRVSTGGGQPVLLTSAAAGGEAAAWSPDGNEFAFTSLVGDTAIRVMVMPAAGGAAVALTGGPVRASNPSWSPDGLRIAFEDFRAGPYRAWTVSRDSVGGPWHEAVPLTGFPCAFPTWAPDARTLACLTSGDLVLISAETGRILRRNVLAAHGLMPQPSPERFSADGRTLYMPAVHRDGRQGIWAVPLMGGPARLVVAVDDPALEGQWFSVGRDRLYLTVYEYESDIWVATLRW